MRITQLNTLAFIPIALLQLLAVQAQLLTDSNAQNLNTALGQKVEYTFFDAGSSDNQLLHLPSTISSSAVVNSTRFSSSSHVPKVTSNVISSGEYPSPNSTVSTQLSTSYPFSSANQTTSSQTTNTIASGTSTGGAGSIKPCLYFVLMLETITHLIS
ncbi:hypothetical protein SKDZ_12G0950 [Saccharomyces kudriavzevii ZP591]|nr:hypothetical protein SKDZ_12G0950 [Saccharomyces kudriavzevii ZP591]